MRYITAIHSVTAARLQKQPEMLFSGVGIHCVLSVTMPVRFSNVKLTLTFYCQFVKNVIITCIISNLIITYVNIPKKLTSFNIYNVITNSLRIFRLFLDINIYIFYTCKQLAKSDIIQTI